jgi:hypothetical protein
MTLISHFKRVILSGVLSVLGVKSWAFLGLSETLRAFYKDFLCGCLSGSKKPHLGASGG